MKLLARELSQLMIAKATSPARLARRGRLKNSEDYLYKILRGERIPPPTTIETIADYLQLPAERRRRLHRAAALDKGYRIGRLYD
jgi:hypothetical protein